MKRPYPAPYWLASDLIGHGFSAEVWDVARAAFGRMLDRDFLEGVHEAMTARRDAFEKQAELSPEDAATYRSLLSMIVRMRLVLENHEEVTRAGSRDELLFRENVPIISILTPLAEDFFFASSARYMEVTASMRTVEGIRELLASPDVVRYRDFIRPMVKEMIERRRPRLVGLSFTFPHHALSVLVLAHEIAAIDPSIHITVGGQMVSYLERHEALQLLHEDVGFHSVTYFIGEDALGAIVRALRDGEPLPELPNVWYRGTPAEGLVRPRYNPPPPRGHLGSYRLPEKDLLGIPPAVRPTVWIPVMQAIGCYWGRCTFCDSRTQNGTNALYSPRAEDELLADIAYYYELGFRRMYIVTDSLPPKPALAIAKGVLERNMQIQWSSFFKIDRRWDVETLSAMARAGYQLPMIGMEHANDRVLKLIDKGYDQAGIVSFFDRVREAGFTPAWMLLILNLPTSTKAENLEVVDFIAKHADRVGWVSYSPFEVVRNTPMSREPAKFGLRLAEDDDPTAFGPRRNTMYVHRYHDDSGMTAAETTEVRQAFDDMIYGYVLKGLYGGLGTVLLGEEAPPLLDGYRFGFSPAAHLATDVVRFTRDGRRSEDESYYLLGTLSTSYEPNEVPADTYEVLRAVGGRELDVPELTQLLRDTLGYEASEEDVVELVRMLVRERYLAYVRSPAGRVCLRGETR
ncbi:MAG: radical SAM protein [Deltaproteobacteria bacterium]|nr:radical SAM protein [Deltaproteobacteria bacterium]